MNHVLSVAELCFCWGMNGLLHWIVLGAGQIFSVKPAISAKLEDGSVLELLVLCCKSEKQCQPYVSFFVFSPFFVLLPYVRGVGFRIMSLINMCFEILSLVWCFSKINGK